MQAAILAPGVALIFWTLVMLVWTAATRFPAMAKAGINAKTAAPGGRGQNLEGVLPDSVNWKAHNYTHLLEQPTLFYPLILILAVLGASQTDVMVAWIYVVLRIIHSLWQALVNRIPVRLALFALSTLCLVVLAISAARLTLMAA